jgi:DNA modification methylase
MTLDQHAAFFDYTDGPIRVYAGNCIEVMRDMPDASVDAVVTDPPYGLAATDPAHVAEAIVKWASGERDFLPSGRGFMGKEWDSFVPPPAVWDEAMRVLKPGGHLLAFAGSRTFDLMGLSIRFAGFDIRDSIAWLYGSGFPKSMDVSKAIDKAAGAERESAGPNPRAAQQTPKRGTAALGDFAGVGDLTAPATDAAREWEGWGTALKPAFEPVVVARKPFRGTVAANVLEHGVGALNIDATRIATTDRLGGGAEKATSADQKGHEGWERPWMSDPEAQAAHAARVRENVGKAEALGRHPANVILDESQAAALDEQSGYLKTGHTKSGTGFRSGYVGGEPSEWRKPQGKHDEGGGASRFFYTAKAPKRERPIADDGTAHPTVKPLALMRYLIRLVTPPGGVVLDPFAGSGTTVEAAILEGFDVVGIELTADYLPLIEQRIDRATKGGTVA